MVAGREIAQDGHGCGGICLQHGGDDVIAFDVNVCIDLVSHLQREERETNRAIEGAGSEPLDPSAPCLLYTSRCV